MSENVQTVTVTARGGVTLPESLLRDAHIAPGEEIEARVFSCMSDEEGSREKLVQGIVLLKTSHQEPTIAEGDANHVYNAPPTPSPKQKSKFMAALRACPVKEELNPVPSIASTSNYVIGKTILVVESLANIVSALNDTSISQQNLRDQTKHYLDRALGNLTKIASNVTQTSWDANDSTLIFADPKDGLETLLVKYKLLSQTTNQRKRKKLHSDLGAILRLLENPDKTARTDLEDVLLEADRDIHAINHVYLKLNSVHLGDITWDAFRIEVIEVVQAHLTSHPTDVESSFNTECEKKY